MSHSQKALNIHQIPGAEDLERVFLTSKRISTAVLIFVIMLDVLILVIIIGAEDKVYYILGIAAIVISLFSLKDDYINYYRLKCFSSLLTLLLFLFMDGN